MNLLNGTGLELSDADSASEAFPSLQVCSIYDLCGICLIIVYIGCFCGAADTHN